MGYLLVVWLGQQLNLTNWPWYCPLQSIWIVLYLFAFTFPEAGLSAEYFLQIYKTESGDIPPPPGDIPRAFLIIFHLKLVSFPANPLEKKQFRPCILHTNCKLFLLRAKTVLKHKIPVRATLRPWFDVIGGVFSSYGIRELDCYDVAIAFCSVSSLLFSI